MLVKGGYKIKVLNTINFKKSLHYNPFEYIHDEKDIMKLTNTLIQNTKGEGEKNSEDFWVKAERLLYNALIGYIWYEAPEEEKNFTLLLDMTIMCIGVSLWFYNDKFVKIIVQIIVIIVNYIFSKLFVFQKPQY